MIDSRHSVALCSVGLKHEGGARLGCMRIIHYTRFAGGVCPDPVSLLSHDLAWHNSMQVAYADLLIHHEEEGEVVIIQGRKTLVLEYQHTRH